MWFLDCFVLHVLACGAYTKFYAGLSPGVNTGTCIIPYVCNLIASVFMRIAHVMLAETNGERLWAWCEQAVGGCRITK